VVLLIGSSGSGKSTILGCANLLEDSQQGEIRLKGEAVHWKGSRLNRHPTDPKQVLRRDRTEAEPAARGYLDKVVIADKSGADPVMLSGRQQQRAAIARALCMEPEALLLDEPTSALDPELEQEVIKDLAAEGRTMLIVTHDMKMARDVSNHVVFLHKGLIKEEGTPDQLFGAPKSERLRGLLSSTMAEQPPTPTGKNHHPQHGCAGLHRVHGLCRNP
jgi:polar amino acid transport system ATP-binding protein